MYAILWGKIWMVWWLIAHECKTCLKKTQNHALWPQHPVDHHTACSLHAVHRLVPLQIFLNLATPNIALLMSTFPSTPVSWSSFPTDYPLCVNFCISASACTKLHLTHQILSSMLARVVLENLTLVNWLQLPMDAHIKMMLMWSISAAWPSIKVIVVNDGTCNIGVSLMVWSMTRCVVLVDLSCLLPNMILSQHCFCHADILLWIVVLQFTSYAGSMSDSFLSQEVLPMLQSNSSIVLVGCFPQWSMSIPFLYPDIQMFRNSIKLSHICMS